MTACFLRRVLPHICRPVPYVCAIVFYNTPFVVCDKRNAGFTLLELVFAIAIVAVLTTVAVPGFQTVIQNSRLVTQSNDLISDLGLARTEAIRRSGYVGGLAGVCASADGQNCVGSWVQGRVVFAIEPDGARVVLRAREAPSGSNNLTTNPAGATNITFSGSYGTVSPAPPGGTIDFTVCDSGGTVGRRIVLSTGGRITGTTTKLSAC